MTDVEKARRIRQLRFLPKLSLCAAIFNLCGALVVCAMFTWMNLQWQSAFSSLPPKYRTGLPSQLFNMPWLSLLLGFLIGIPENLWYRRRAANRKEEMIEKMIRPQKKKLSWQSSKSNLLECLPTMASHISAIVIVYLLNLPIYPAMFSVGISDLLKYSNMKEISEEAIRRLNSKPESAFTAITPFN